MTWIIAKNNLVSDWIQDRMKVIGGLLVIASGVNIWLSWQVSAMIFTISFILGVYFLKQWIYSFIPLAKRIDNVYRSFFGWKIGEEVVLNIPFGKKIAGTIVDRFETRGVTRYIIEINDEECIFEYAYAWELESYAYSDY